MSADAARRETEAFVRSRALHDDPFVEVGERVPTVEAARFGLETLAALEVEPGESTRAAVDRLLDDCARPDGGYAMRRDDGPSELAATYYATRLMTAGLVGRVPDSERIAEYVRRSVLGDGGARVWVDVDDLYYGMRAVALAAVSLSGDEHEAVHAFMSGCAHPDGGFGLVPGAEPDVERTYCCLHMLQFLGADEVGPRHARFVGACSDGELIHWSPAHERSYPATMYWGARAAQIAGVDLDWDRLARGMESFRRPGGGYAAGGEPDLWLTYCGTRTLEIARQRVAC